MKIGTIVAAASLMLVGVGAASAAPQLDVRYRTVPCSFPNGWNAGDASRADRGIPNGIHHQCVVDRHGIVRDSQGRRTS